MKSQPIIDLLFRVQWFIREVRLFIIHNVLVTTQQKYHTFGGGFGFDHQM